MYVSSGILHINSNFKITIKNNVGNLIELTSNLSDLYKKINPSFINSSSFESRLDLLARKSRSEDFKSLFNLNFILDQLKNNCKEGFFDTKWSYEIVSDKVLLYKDGDFFKKHKDHAVENIENNGEHVGTFLLFLNSIHKGGDLIVYKNNVPFILNTQPITSDFGNIFKFILFSLDVDHEVLKLESGIRGCLKFKIYRYRNVVQSYEYALEPHITKERLLNYTSTFDQYSYDKDKDNQNNKPTLFD